MSQPSSWSAVRGVNLPWPRPSWRALLLVGYALLNLALLASEGVRYLGSLPHDWQVWLNVPSMLESGELYRTAEGPTWFVWSPFAAWLLAGVFVPLGYPLWFGLHLAVVPLLRDPRLIALTLLSVAFWVDTIIGNSLVFVFVAGAVALRGSRVGAIAYLALFCLMPRPVQAPLALWLLWSRPETRVPFAVMVGATLFAAVASGWALDWAYGLFAIGRDNYGHFANFSPTRVIGAAWLLMGVPLAVWLTSRGVPGLAGLAMSPYILPMYWIVVVWDLIRKPEEARA